MSWCTEMVGGVYLGMLVICLIQAEYVSTLWGKEGQHVGSQRLNLYGTLQHGGGMTRVKYPQDKLGQTAGPRAAQSSRLHGQRLVSGGYVQPPSGRPASVKFVQSSSVSSPPVRRNSYVTNAPNKQLSRLSTSRKTSQTYGFTDKRKVTKTPQQGGARRTGQRLSTSETASRGSYLFTPGAQNLQSMMQQQGVAKGAKASKPSTSASTLGRKVSSRKTSAGLSRSLGNVKAGTRQASRSQNTAKSRVPLQSSRHTEARLLAPTMKHNIPAHFGGATIRRLKQSDWVTAGVQRPQTYTVPPQQQVGHRPAVGRGAQSGGLGKKWSFKPRYR